MQRVLDAPVRALVVTSMYPTAHLPHYGVFVAEQVRSLRSAGVDLDVVFVNPRETRLNYVLGLPRVLEKLRRTPYHVIHTHHTYTVPLVSAARRLAHCRAPIILTNHEGEMLDRRRRARPWQVAATLRSSTTVKRWMAGQADFVIFVSQQLSDALATNGQHQVIPCGVDLIRFAPADRRSCRTRLGLPSDAHVLFFPPAPGARGKRFELVQAMFGILRDRTLNVKLVTGGGIPYEMMPVYYNAADVVLQSSFYEASPTIVKEALACEIPLVSTDSGDTREIIEGVPFCFVCRDDPREMAARVMMCLGRRASGGRAQLMAKGLSLEQVAHRLVQLYQMIGRP